MISNRVRLGASLLDQRRPSEALACFEGSEEIEALFGRAVALQLMENFEAAQAAYELVLTRDPRHEEAWANLIAMHMEAFDLERVRECSLKLVDVNRNSQIALRALAVVAIERRDYEIAAYLFALIVPDPGVDDGTLEYRVSREIVEKLRSMHGPLAHQD